MYINPSLQATRKAFQELTGIKHKDAATLVLCIETNNTRWDNCKNVISFSDICLSSEYSKGKLVCVSPDASKAKWTSGGTTCHTDFLLGKAIDLDTEAKIDKAVKCILEAYKDVDVIFFEKIRDFSNGLKFIDFVNFVKKNIPIHVTAVFSIPEDKAKDLTDRFDVVMELTERLAYVHTSNTLMCDFNFTLKA